MFKKVTFKDVLTLILLIALTVIIGYFYVNSLARNLLWLKTYPIRAELSIQNITCTELC